MARLLVSRAGHLPHLDQPGQVARLVNSFLREPQLIPELPGSYFGLRELTRGQGGAPVGCGR